MRALGRKRSVYYFDSEGRQNLNKTLALVASRVAETGIRKVVVFTRDGKGAFAAADRLKGIQVIAVTFPYKQQFPILDVEGREDAAVPPTSLPEVVEKMRTAGIRLVRGTMPFQQIVIPYARDAKMEGIRHALGLFGAGMLLCIQAVLMSTDAGEVEPGEEVVAMSADTAIVATGALSHWLFHPEEGMEIREVICKPRVLTVSRDKTPRTG